MKIDETSIAEVVHMPVSRALETLERWKIAAYLDEPLQQLKHKLHFLESIGLGYLSLDRSAPTLSGGETQRIRLSCELARRSSGKTLYLLDEPTIGLHSDDIVKLLKIFHQLVDRGNTLVVIEHNLDVIKNADFLFDLGPGAGEDGGHLIASGTPEEIKMNPNSITGKFL